ncbi:DNA cytosine methyltransferase [Bradyrhizobium sp. CCBAU 45389]|uniref:DNA cytosine methyltransferase n=1 Tax=Bradyrhizobium sp. CCBAU 45389 TaxID=858429 RepID=UPI0023060324|nr:DNA cytosine methyltransferase [Bradyrhizobium sp. CCBAU 45389]MDA9398929.1 cytosine methyltransferase [Bradyrhizobium sp. CCBAU 45389]
MKKLTAISLYTGAGGLDYGFEAAGFRTAVAVEMDERCVETLRANRRWPTIQGDINSVRTEEILGKAKLCCSEPDVLIGGPPCQPFSKSGFWATGSTKRLKDPRASTLENYLRVLEETQPRAFLMENVEGLGFKGKDEGLLHIQNRLEEINAKSGTKYTMSTAVLNAADFGVPQLRRRLFIIGSRDGSSFRFPTATHASSVELLNDQRQHLTAWDALRSVRLSKSEAISLRMKGKWANLLPSVPEGQNYLWHTERGGGEPLFGWRRRYWSFLLKLAKNSPSWTIQAQPGPATGPFHWDNRLLSVREMARLQTFPNDVKIAGTYADAQRQLGNAVPSLLAEVLAREISSQLLGRSVKKPLGLAIRPSKAPIPAPGEVVAVPVEYLTLRGDHEAHPGTGRGYRAVSREGLGTEEFFELTP